MAKNREPESEPEESLESEEEGEESSDTGSEAASEEDRPLPTTLPNNPAPQTLPPSESDDGGEDDSESESESESDNNPTPDPKTVAKPIHGQLKPGEFVPPASGVKRGSETVPKEMKRLKTAVESGGSKSVGENSAKKLFQRVFSEEDEIALLKGMLDFHAKKKSDPVANIVAFHEFIRKAVHVDVTKNQLQDKIRRLKIKYEKNAVKVKNGKNRTFGKQHDKDTYELSEKIWGRLSSENNMDSAGLKRVLETPKVNGSVAKKSRSKIVAKGEGEEMKDSKVESDCEREGLKKSIRAGSSGGSAGVGGLSLYSDLEQRIMAEKIEEGKQAELDYKWREFEVEELQLYVKRAKLICERAKSLISIKKRDL